MLHFWNRKPKRQSVPAARLFDWIFFVGICLVIVGTWWGLGYGVWVYFGRRQELSGPFGDTFGFASSLFAALAFAGVVFGLQLQRRQMRADAEIQRETAKLTALVALAEHAGNAFQHAVSLELPPETREARAGEYDAWVKKLQDRAADLSDSAGFGFLEMERLAARLPPILVSDFSVRGVAGNATIFTEVEVAATIMSRTDHSLTVRHSSVRLIDALGKPVDIVLGTTIETVMPRRGTAVRLTGRVSGRNDKRASLPRVASLSVDLVGYTAPYVFDVGP